MLLYIYYLNVTTSSFCRLSCGLGVLEVLAFCCYRFISIYNVFLSVMLLTLTTSFLLDQMAMVLALRGGVVLLILSWPNM